MRQQRFWLYRRDGVFYLHDSQSGKRESLETRSRSEAQEVRKARNQASERPTLGLALAKAYLSTQDPQIVQRTWEDVRREFCARGKPQTQLWRKRAMRSKPFGLLKHKKLLETTLDDFFAALRVGGVVTHSFLRCVHNLALGLGWLAWPVLPLKLWPTVHTKPKRGITWDEHQKIIAAEQNVERRLYYEILREVGASQTDAASLCAENIDWQTRVLAYQRRKTGQWAYLRVGERLEKILRQLPAKGPLFPKISRSADTSRAAEFRRRCRLLKIEGISLHSYRYGWAERAKGCGYPGRWAQNALGHNSSAVHQAYAKGHIAICPPLDEYEQAVPRPPANQAQPA